MLASPDEIHQVIYNLTENGVKYTGSGGAVQVSLRREGEWVELSVADNGPGIPEEDLDRIFERFYRVDKGRSRELGGTGLGLSIVKHIVGLYGGDVSVASEPQVGTTFTVRLPME